MVRADFGRGGAIILNDEKEFEHIKTFVASFEGFPTFGGMSVKEMEAIRVGLDDTMDENVIAQGPQFIEYLATELEEAGIPAGLVRMSCGLEHKDDLIADIEQALK